MGEAATLYLSKLQAKDRDTSQPEVYKFARWYGWESQFSRLAGPAVASYAEQLTTSDTDYNRKFEILRAFLAYGKKAGWSQTNLAVHLKTKKGKSAPVAAAGRSMPEAAALTIGPPTTVRKPRCLQRAMTSFIEAPTISPTFRAAGIKSDGCDWDGRFWWE